MFSKNKNYEITSWGDGPSMYFGVIDNGDVIQYTAKEKNLLSSFASYFRITSDLEKRDKTEDKEDYYTVRAEFDAELINTKDSTDIIKITDGNVELWIVDFQSNIKRKS